MFGFIVALVIFGLMLWTVALGFRASERAVNTADKAKREREIVSVHATEVRAR